MTIKKKSINVRVDVDLDDILDQIDEEDVLNYYGINCEYSEHKPGGQPDYLVLLKRELTKTPLNKEELKELICNYIDENIHNVIF